MCEQASPFNDEIEVDESYFDAHQVRGKRGQDVSGKAIVFGLLNCHGCVDTKIVSDVSKAATGLPPKKCST